MEKILVAGASGVLGHEIVKVLHERGRSFCVQIHDPAKREKLLPYCQDIRVADVTRPDTLRGICKGVETVIDTIGKSVSLFTNSPQHFMDIDYRGNLNLLQEAKQAGVGRFTYVGILGSETSPKLRQGWAQELFAQALMDSGLAYQVVKPTGLFSGLHDLLIMGRRGLVPTIGNGRAVTNPIHQRDLAEYIVDKLDEGTKVMEVGGPDTHTRGEVSEWVREISGARGMTVPPWMARSGSHLFKPVKPALYDKLRFFTYITTHDMVAPPTGYRKLRPYLEDVYRDIT